MVEHKFWTVTADIHDIDIYKWFIDIIIKSL